MGTTVKNILILTAVLIRYKVNPTIMQATQDVSNCEPIAIPMCDDLSYKETIMPNILGHKSQNEAGRAMRHFQPLVKVRCSPYLQFFLCSVYVPMCSESGVARQSCRSLCLKARNGCESLLNSHGLQWPHFLQCQRFPVSDNCVAEDELALSTTLSPYDGYNATHPYEKRESVIIYYN